MVKNVRRETGGIPIVMHGGSGVSKEDFHAAIRAGVRKINYFTYMDKAGGQAAESYLQGLEPHAPRFFSSVLAAAQQAMQENLISAMKTFALMEDQ